MYISNIYKSFPGESVFQLILDHFLGKLYGFAMSQEKIPAFVRTFGCCLQGKS